MQALQRDDHVIHYRFMPGEAGQPTVVFINSLGTDFRIWEAVVALLPPRFSILLHDKQGHGLSGLGPGPRHIGDYAGDVLALLDHLRIDRPVLCGLSVGGIIAQHILIHHPGRAAAAILSNTAAKVGTEESWNDRIAAVKTGGIASIAGMVMERWFSPAFHRTRAAELALYTHMLTRTDADGYTACCAAIREADYRSGLSGIGVPVLCIGGTHDGATPPAIVKDTAAAIPGARYVEMENAGHLPCIESPEAYAQAVSGLIASLPASY